MRNDSELVAQIETAQRTVSTDQYPMSIGELANLYRDGEIVLNPKFQRFYRWSVSQKSALIESILIGIPVPPIFCYEREDSRWEIIDGVQRVSTILEFMGVLQNAEGVERSPLKLARTDYLPALDNACWEAPEDSAEEEGHGIPATVQIAFKRSKIGIQIIKKASTPKTKYDLFQRLNSNGSPLTPQEYRSCMLVMINEAVFDSLVKFARSPFFYGLLRLDDDDREKQYDIDYACRLLTHTFFEYERRDKDIDEFISDSVKRIFADRADEVEPFLEKASQALGVLWEVFEDGALRRQANGKAIGRAGKVGFEVVAIGVVSNWDVIRTLPDITDFLRQRVAAVWKEDIVVKASSPGLRGTDRIRLTVPFGKAWFKP